MMAGAVEPPRVSNLRLRLVLCLGPALFVMFGLAGAASDAFLTYPPHLAKSIILLIEAGLALSIAATVGLLVTGEPRRTT